MSAEFTEEERQSTLDRWEARAEASVSCTTPIYWRNPRGRLELYGSGVLIRYGSLHAIVSAAHVFEDGGERWIGGARSRIDLPGAFLARTRRDIPPPLKCLDLAITPLPAQVVAVANSNKRFLTMADVVPIGTPAVGALHYAVGYPNGRTLPFREDEPLHAEWFAVGAKAAPPTRYVEAGLSENLNLLLDFDLTSTEGRDGTGRCRKLNGMSGGGIWRFEEEFGVDQLAAIFTAYRSGETSYLIATRIEVVVRALAAYISGELVPKD